MLRRLVRRAYRARTIHSYSTQVEPALSLLQENFLHALQSKYPTHEPKALSYGELIALANQSLSVYELNLTMWQQTHHQSELPESLEQSLAEFRAFIRDNDRLLNNIIIPVTNTKRSKFFDYQSPKTFNCSTISSILMPFRYGYHRIEDTRITHRQTPNNFRFAIEKMLDYYLLLFRSRLNTAPLKALLDALSNDQTLYLWFQRHLRNKPFQKTKELWRAGFHEHLPCSNFRDILERAAGLHSNVEAFSRTKRFDKLAAIDLLTLFWRLRSRSSSLFFKPEEPCAPLMVISGHSPALKTALPEEDNLGADCSAGTTAYHQQLSDNVENTNSVMATLNGAQSINEALLLNGDEPLVPSQEPRYTIEGYDTRSSDDLDRLKKRMQKESRQRASMFDFFQSLLEPIEEVHHLDSKQCRG